MFKIEDVYVDDKKLGELLKAMAGLVRGQPRPVHVANVEDSHTGLRAKTNGANLVQVYAGHLGKTHAKEITPDDVRAWLVKQGYSKLSYSYILKGLSKAGVLKRGAGKTHKAAYIVQRAKS